MKNSFVARKKIQSVKFIQNDFIEKNTINIRIGDILRVGIKIDEGKNERVQYYEGLVIKGKNSGISKTITVRRVVQGIGTERVLPLNSPKLVSFEQKRSSVVRKSKLYYIRNLSGKATRLKQRF